MSSYWDRVERAARAAGTPGENPRGGAPSVEEAKRRYVEDDAYGLADLEEDLEAAMAPGGKPRPPDYEGQEVVFDGGSAAAGASRPGFRPSGHETTTG